MTNNNDSLISYLEARRDLAGFTDEEWEGATAVIDWLKSQFEWEDALTSEDVLQEFFAWLNVYDGFSKTAYDLRDLREAWVQGVALGRGSEADERPDTRVRCGLNPLKSGHRFLHQKGSLMCALDNILVALEDPDATLLYRIQRATEIINEVKRGRAARDCRKDV